nr:MAG TPA: hypothetical protein [Caudoviricetes sp.]
MGLSFKEVGKITLRTFNKLYQCYKDNFDLELHMKSKNLTYQMLAEKEIESEEWIN